jgi:carboxymethylenebutenolidase
MIEFGAEASRVPGYLATPTESVGPSVVVLHAWWGLTEPFRQVCDRLAEAGFVALAPDLYRGKTTAAVEEAEVLSAALGRDVGRMRGDITGAIQLLRQHDATNLADNRDRLAVVGFSLGGAFALDISVELAEEIAAVVTFYASYTGPDYRRAKAAYLCHFAEDDPFEPPEAVAAMEQELEAVGRPAIFYTYPGTKHWFFEPNRPDAFDAAAASLAWERTLAFLTTQLRPA